MKVSKKIIIRILIALGILVIIVACLIILGLYTMAIEDRGA